MENQKNRGNNLGFFLFAFILKIFKLSGAYILLYFVATFYLIFDKNARTKATPYLQNKFAPAQKIKLYIHIYKLFISQGQHLIDLYAFQKKLVTFNSSIKGFDQFEELTQNKKSGVILLTSHFSNWQMALSNLKQIDKKVCLVMKEEDNKAIKEYLNFTNQKNFKIISPDSFLGGTIEIMKELNDGNIISIMGDRSYGADTLKVPFLGKTANFPYSAFHIAAMSNSPICCLFAKKEKHKTYQVEITPPIYAKYQNKKDKKEQLRSFLIQYTQVLEQYIHSYPYQFFLFDDNWNNKV